MGFFTSRLLLALAIIGGQAAPMFAEEASSLAALPAFVSQTGRANYSEAVNDTRSNVQARRAAEALSAKFSDMTTSSISKDERSSAIAYADPSVVERSDASRSIVLAVNRPEDPKNPTFEAPEPAPKALAPTRRIPRRAMTKTSEPVRRGTSAQAPHNTLASIGQKVGFLDLLTNPALWH